MCFTGQDFPSDGGLPFSISAVSLPMCGKHRHSLLLLDAFLLSGLREDLSCLQQIWKCEKEFDS